MADDTGMLLPTTQDDALEFKHSDEYRISFRERPLTGLF